MDNVFDKIKTGAKNLKATYDSGMGESNAIGPELKARAEMNNAAATALGKSTPAAPTAASPSTPSPVDKVNKGREYGDKEGQKHGEKKIETKEMLKPLGSFKKGTDRVPKTGNYMLHEGEAVIPAEKNPMNVADAMAGISGRKKPPKKIAEIRSKKSHDGKIIHTHIHHHPQHHENETYVSNDAAGAAQHMQDQEPNMSAAAPEAEAPEAAPAAGPVGPAAAGM